MFSALLMPVVEIVKAISLGVNVWALHGFLSARLLGLHDGCVQDTFGWPILLLML